jgi:hypothetical protein
VAASSGTANPASIDANGTLASFTPKARPRRRALIAVVKARAPPVSTNGSTPPAMTSVTARTHQSATTVPIASDASALTATPVRIARRAPMRSVRRPIGTALTAAARKNPVSAMPVRASSNPSSSPIVADSAPNRNIGSIATARLMLTVAAVAAACRGGEPAGGAPGT